MAQNNIVVNAKQNNNNYTTLYPVSEAYHTKRTKKLISYLEGENLLEVLQTTANIYLTPQYTDWTEKVQRLNLTSDSRMCVKDNFVCIVTPQLTGEDYSLNCAITHNGGITWGTTTFTPQTDNYILNIIGVECVRVGRLNYLVTLVGRRYITDTKVYTYQLTIQHNDFFIKKSQEFDVI